jgi:hypothetical protein
VKLKGILNGADAPNEVKDAFFKYCRYVLFFLAGTMDVSATGLPVVPDSSEPILKFVLYP